MKAITLTLLFSLIILQGICLSQTEVRPFLLYKDGKKVHYDKVVYTKKHKYAATKNGETIQVKPKLLDAAVFSETDKKGNHIEYMLKTTVKAFRPTNGLLKTSNDDGLMEYNVIHNNWIAIEFLYYSKDFSIGLFHPGNDPQPVTYLGVLKGESIVLVSPYAFQGRRDKGFEYLKSVTAELPNFEPVLRELQLAYDNKGDVRDAHRALRSYYFSTENYSEYEYQDQYRK